MLKERIIVARLIAPVRVVEESLSGGFVFLVRVVENKIDLRNPIEDKVGECGLVRIVWRAHLHAHTNTLVVLLCQVEDVLQIVGQLDASGTRLHLSPRRANVEQIAQREADEVFDGL